MKMCVKKYKTDLIFISSFLFLNLMFITDEPGLMYKNYFFLSLYFVAFIFCGIKIAVTNYSLKEIVFLGALSLISVISFYNSHQRWILVLCLMVIFMKDINTEKIWKGAFIFSAAGLIIRFFLACLGLKADPQRAYFTKDFLGTVIRCGMGYCCDNVLHARLLIVTALFILMKKGNVKKKHILYFVLLNCFLFLFTFTYAAFLAEFLLLFLIIIPQKEIVLKYILKPISYFTLPLFIIISIVLPITYQNISFGEKINYMVSNRLRWTKLVFDKIGFSFLGKGVIDPFVDNSYADLLIEGGIVLFVIYMVILYISIIRITKESKKENYHKLAIILVFLTYCISEQVLIIPFRNVSLFLLIEAFYSIMKKEEPIWKGSKYNKTISLYSIDINNRFKKNTISKSVILGLIVGIILWRSCEGYTLEYTYPLSIGEYPEYLIESIEKGETEDYLVDRKTGEIYADYASAKEYIDNIDVYTKEKQIIWTYNYRKIVTYVFSSIIVIMLVFGFIVTIKSAKKGKNRLKIAMIGHKHIPGREGGIEIVVYELSRRMVQKGHKVVAYNRSGHHISGKEFDSVEYDKLKEYQGINIKTIPTIHKKGYAAFIYSFLASICVVGKGYDVVHYHAEGPCAFMWIPHLFGIRTVATIHGLDWQRTGKWGGFASKIIKFGEWVACKTADELIVLSKHEQDYFREKYNRETHMIPNGIDKPSHTTASIIEDKYGLQENDYILSLSRITREKKIDLLINAFKEIKTEKKLVIAGGGSDDDGYLKEIHDLAKTDNRIFFTGFVQGRELEELYSNAYIYCLPSELEGMPISLLEAMSYGNCCLTSDIPECKAVIEDKGRCFICNNLNCLKEELQFLIENTNMVNDLKNKSSEFICNKYRWNNVVEKTLKVYEI